MDTLIIGSGIAGLYYAYKYCMPRHEKFLILEKNPTIGGRLKMITFHGHHVVGGAGVGRWKKDKLLKKLLRELRIDFKKTPSTKQHSRWHFPPERDCFQFIKHVLKRLEEFHRHNPGYMGSFSDVMMELFDAQVLEKFLELNGFRDFTEEDYRETISHYGLIDDNVRSPLDIFHVDWIDLAKRLASQIGGKKHIKLRCKVEGIRKDANGWFSLNCCGNRQYKGRKIVFATEIATIQTLLFGGCDFRYISGQPFSRIYVKFDAASAKKMVKYVQGYTIVPGPLQKIIPISPEDGIYMLGYNDNRNAELTRNMSNSELAFLVKDLFREKFHIVDSKVIYWKTGTHYFRPYSWDIRESKMYLKKMQNPEPNIMLVGEAFSFNQGWVEGALESVESIIN